MSPNRATTYCGGGSNNGVTLTISGRADQCVYYTFTNNTWYHLVAIQEYSGASPSKVVYYVNGVNIANKTTSTSYISASGRTAVIGYPSPANSNYFNGQLDELAFFNKSLTYTEVQQLYNSGSGLYGNVSVSPYNSNVVSAYHFDEMTGTVVDDFVDSNDGTIINGGIFGTGVVAHNVTTSIIGVSGLIPIVTGNNYISSDTSLQWLNNILLNPWNTISKLGNSTNKWDIYARNITADYFIGGIAYLQDLIVSGTSLFNGAVTVNNTLNVSQNTTVNNLIVNGNFSAKRPYGMFSSTEDQTLALANTAYPVTFNWTDDSYEILKEGNSNFSVQQSGDYLIELSAIFQSAVSNKKSHLWVQIWNGTAWNNVPRSNTEMTIRTINSDYIVAVPFMLDIHSNEKFRIMWAGDDNSIFLNYMNGTSFAPETPSIIMVASKQSEVTN